MGIQGSPNVTGDPGVSVVHGLCCNQRQVPRGSPSYKACIHGFRLFWLLVLGAHRAPVMYPRGPHLEASPWFTPSCLFFQYKFQAARRLQKWIKMIKNYAKYCSSKKVFGRGGPLGNLGQSWAEQPPWLSGTACLSQAQGHCSVSKGTWVLCTSHTHTHTHITDLDENPVSPLRWILLPHGQESA